MKDIGIIEILKPSKFKIILISVLFFLPIILQYSLLSNRDNQAYGFPFPIIETVTYQCGLGSLCPEPFLAFNAFSLIIDIIVLHIAAMLIVFTLEKSKKITKNNYTKTMLLALILFFIFMAFSYIFSFGYPFIKAMVGIGLPLAFCVYDPYTGLGIQLGSFFTWQYLLIDIIYWFIASIIIIWIGNKFEDKT